MPREKKLKFHPDLFNGCSDEQEVIAENNGLQSQYINGLGMKSNSNYWTIVPSKEYGYFQFNNVMIRAKCLGFDCEDGRLAYFETRKGILVLDALTAGDQIVGWNGKNYFRPA